MAYLDDVKAICRATEQAKQPYVDRWLINVAMFKNKQFHDWSRVYGLSAKRNKPKWRVELSFNYIRAIALTMAAKLTMNRPGWTVKPATSDQDDRDKARMSQLLLDYVWEELRCQSKLYHTALVSVLCGIGWWGVCWDKTAGMDWIDRAPDGTDSKTGRTGFPQIDSILPFDIGIDPFATDDRAAEWGYRIRLVSLDWARKMYAKTLKGDTAASDDELTSRLENAPVLRTVEDAAALQKNYTSIVEFYDVAKGKFIVFAPREGTVLQQGRWNMPVPFIPCRNIPNIGDIEEGGVGSNCGMGETVISDLIDLQKQLNRSECQLLEMNNLIAYPRIMAHSSARLDPLSLIDAPGSVMTYHGMGQPPQPFHLGSVPGWSFNLPERIKDRMHDISGVHEISYGAQVGSIQSGRGLAILAEQDATKFAPMARSLSEMVRQAAVQILLSWRAFATGKYTVRVVGQNSGLEVFEFFDSDVTSTDVQVELGSTFAGNKALRIDQSIQAWDRGIIQDRRLMQRMMEFGETNPETLDIHRMKQQREIEAILSGDGASVKIEPFHDHFVHLDRLTEFLNSTTFEKLDLAAQDELRAHYEAHMQQVQQQMQQDALAAQQRGVAAAGKSEGVPQMPMMPGGPGGVPSMGVDRLAEAFPGAGAGTMLQGGGLKQ
jgi:hypothetical protein